MPANTAGVVGALNGGNSGYGVWAHISSPAAADAAIYAENTSPGTAMIAVAGGLGLSVTAMGPNGDAIYASASSSSPTVIITNSGSAQALSLTSSAPSSNTLYLRGNSSAPVLISQNDSTSFVVPAIQGLGSGAGIGVKGNILSTNGAINSIGVYGLNPVASGYGVKGEATDSAGVGIYAVNSAQVSNTAGAALYVSGVVRVQGGSLSMAPGPTATLNAVAGRIIFTSAGTMTSLTVNDNYVKNTSIIVFNTNFTTAPGFPPLLNVTNTGFTVTWTSAVNPTTNDGVNFLVINQ
jgi:hypothetical protein